MLLVGYAIYQGQQVNEDLAKRMKENANLEVKLFLNISRPDQDTTASEILVSRYTQRFKDKQWPSGCRLPEVYYDPRSVADDEPVRSSLHANCVVVDAERVFVSSANFTEAGQQKVTTIEQLEDRITNAKEAGRKSLLLLVRRGGEPRFVALGLS